LRRYVQAEQSEDGRIERLMSALEQCKAGCRQGFIDLLHKFYAALEAAGQENIVRMLRVDEE